MRKEQEDKIIEFWKRKKIYQKVKKNRSKAKKFYFLDGPPYATGSIHIGTAQNKILKDCYIRFWRMHGYDVWDQPGYDTHGLPIENKVEKELGIKSKADIERIGIEKFITDCRGFATKYIDVMSQQFADLGVWMDWQKPYLTLDNDYIEGAWHTFKIAFQKKLLYHGLYPVHVCPHCETAVAYNEIEYSKATDPSIYVKFPVRGNKNTFLVIWTTTPWTLPANTGVMAHPDADYVRVEVDGQTLILAKDLLESVMKKISHENYKLIGTVKGKDLEGMNYEHPLHDMFAFQRMLKNAHRVVLSRQFVTMETGTGLVHTAPGHGQEDYKVGVENRLPVVSPVKLNGTFNEECGELSGMFVKHADKLIIKKLQEKGLLLHEEKITHDYPECWRCNSPLLLISVPQWFFRVTAIRKKLLAENRKVAWHPDWAKQRFQNWLENLGDWPISRQRYWGIPLPIWKCNCGNVKVIGSRKEIPKVKDLHRPYIDKITIKCGCGSWMKRIPDVLDVWFDSGLASWASLGYPKSKKLFKRLWPSDLQMEGPDQIRGWWNSELITSVITFDKAPFKSILFHGFVLDAHGVKMSKSKGNIVMPGDIVKKYGRDVLRYYLLSSPPWDDFYFKWVEVEDIAKSFTVIENTFNFIKTYAMQYDKPVKLSKKTRLNIEDKWILSRLNSLVAECAKNFMSYNAHKAATDVHNFIVNDFSRWYIKLIRDRVWPAYAGKDKEAAFYTLHEVARTVIKLLSPVCPFLAEYVHQNVVKEKSSVHLCDWPKPDKKLIDKKLEKKMDMIRGIVETANAMRQESVIKLRWPLSKITIECDENLSGLESILMNICNVKTVGFGKAEGGRAFSHGKVWVDTKLTEELKEEAMLREVIRKVQDMRKKSGLVVKDKIELVIHGADVMKKFNDRIRHEVGAEEILYNENNGEIINFEGRQVKVEIKKL